MKQLLICLAIAAAGSLGALARYGVANLFAMLNVEFPLGTMFINLSGSLFLGWFMAYTEPRNVDQALRLGIGVGFVGAYTTFSTYMYESLKLLNKGAVLESLVNLFGSLILGMIAVWLGFWLGTWLNKTV
jgi:CrcB protein